MELSCAFPAAVQHVEHAVLAEALGYERVWFYDSPALYERVWTVLALSPPRTTRGGLGPAVVVPDLRRRPGTAARLAPREQLAPARDGTPARPGCPGRTARGH